MTDYDSQRFDQYFLDRLIGRGGFADVYRAWDSNLNRWVAIKVLRKNLTDKELKKFFKEARIMAKLRHPHIITIFAFNIVQVFDLNEYHNIPYLVMDYAQNGSLAERHLHGERLHMDIIMQYLEQIVDALEYIHNFRLENRRLVHQDIKPANILIGANDEILISDFGIAKFVQDTHSKVASTSEENLIGTAIYTAPERFKGQPSPAADQYALGVILYEWLTGSYPFYGTNSEIMHLKLNTEPPSLRSIAPDIPLSIEQVVLKALRRNQYSRFKSVRELLLALDEARHPSFPRSLIAFIQGRY
jgi:eukaryotic-like serine/threonine-protein kinase